MSKNKTETDKKKAYGWLIGIVCSIVCNTLGNDKCKKPLLSLIALTVVPICVVLVIWYVRWLLHWSEILPSP